MKFTIETSDNGIKIKGTGINAVFETTDNIEKQQEFLYELINVLDWYTGRYAEKKLQVDITHGDKYECFDKECSVCKNLIVIDCDTNVDDV